MKKVEKEEKGNKVVVPLGAGVMIEAGIDNVRKVMFSYAGGAVTHKTIPDVRQELNKRLELIRKENEQALVEREKIEKGLTNLRNILMLADKNARANAAAGKGQRNV